ncbi:MAG: hypothetical protein U0637_12690 [Phycisphaerales bacterium]
MPRPPCPVRRQVHLAGLSVRERSGTLSLPWNQVQVVNQYATWSDGSGKRRTALRFCEAPIARRLCERARRRDWAAGTLSISPAKPSWLAPTICAAALLLLLAMGAYLAIVNWRPVQQTLTIAPALATITTVAGALWLICHTALPAIIIFSRCRLNASDIVLNCDGIHGVLHTPCGPIPLRAPWSQVSEARYGLLQIHLRLADGPAVRMQRDAGIVEALRWMRVPLYRSDNRPMWMLLRSSSVLWIAGVLAIGIVTRLLLPQGAPAPSWSRLAAMAAGLPLLIAVQMFIPLCLQEPRQLRRWWKARIRSRP